MRIADADPPPYSGPVLFDGSPDMDSSEWNEYCSSAWWGAVQEADIVAGIEGAALTELQRVDVEDLLHLVRLHADTHRRPRASASTMRIPLLQSLARLVDAIAARPEVQPPKPTPSWRIT